jgi:hypothetical protein
MLREQGLSVPTPNPNPIIAPTAAPDFRIRLRDGSGVPLQAL